MINAPRVRAILSINRYSSSSVLGRAHLINNGMGSDTTLFLTPDPPLVTFEGQITTFDTAQQLAATRARGAAAARNVQRQLLVGMMESQCTYVQKLCDRSPALALSIIQTAGMVSALFPTHNDSILKATDSAQSGSVDLDANVNVLTNKSTKRRFFNWQWTTDGGKTFNNALSTPHGKTTITNLTPLTMVGFRVSVTIGTAGPGDWSQVVTILVH